MFSIINSLSLRQFLVLIALLIVGCIGGLVQCKRSNQYGKGAEFFCYFSIFFGIVLGVNKVLRNTGDGSLCYTSNRRIDVNQACNHSKINHAHRTVPRAI